MNNSYKYNNFIYAAYFARRIINLVEVNKKQIFFLLFFINTFLKK